MGRRPLHPRKGEAALDLLKNSLRSFFCTRPPAFGGHIFRLRYLTLPASSLSPFNCFFLPASQPSANQQPYFWLDRSIPFPFSIFFMYIICQNTQIWYSFCDFFLCFKTKNRMEDVHTVEVYF